MAEATGRSWVGEQARATPRADASSAELARKAEAVPSPTSIDDELDCPKIKFAPWPPSEGDEDAVSSADEQVRVPAAVRKCRRTARMRGQPDEPHAFPAPACGSLSPCPTRYMLSPPGCRATMRAYMGMIRLLPGAWPGYLLR
jgi:hypothetical protein